MATTTHFTGSLRGPQHVFIATPTYTGKLDAGYVASFLHSLEHLKKHDITFEHYVMSHNCHVDDSRNGIVRDFLASEATDLVFIDADVTWRPIELLKLIQHDRDVVAGVYPKRSLTDPDYPVRVEPGVVLQADKDGLVEVSGAPTGFMKIKRHVLEKLVEQNKERRFYGMGAVPGKDKPYTIVFERTLEDGHRWSGDYAFCLKWRKLGGKIYVDPYMELNHVGEVTFSGTLAHHWKKKHGVLAMEKDLMLDEALAEIKSGQIQDSTWDKLVRGWDNPFAAEVELIVTMYHLAKQSKGPILETGTGLTTLVMALANPDAEIHSLEHDPVWASATKYRLDYLGIKNVSIHFAPLKDYEDGKWYNAESLPAKNYDLVLCDGPPRRISNRSLLYTMLYDQIRDSRVLVMDDADDDAAVAPIKSWSEGLGRSVDVMGQKRRFALSLKKESKDA